MNKHACFQKSFQNGLINLHVLKTFPFLQVCRFLVSPMRIPQDVKPHVALLCLRPLEMLLLICLDLVPSFASLGVWDITGDLFVFSSVSIMLIFTFLHLYV